MSKQEIIAELQAERARAKVLRRELGMLRKAQAHLRGLPARHNLRRIADREEELASVEALIELTDRVGVDEVARCEAAACERRNVNPDADCGHRACEEAAR